MEISLANTCESHGLDDRPRILLDLWCLRRSRWFGLVLTVVVDLISVLLLQSVLQLTMLMLLILRLLNLWIMLSVGGYLVLNEDRVVLIRGQTLSIHSFSKGVVSLRRSALVLVLVSTIDCYERWLLVHLLTQSFRLTLCERCILAVVVINGD